MKIEEDVIKKIVPSKEEERSVKKIVGELKKEMIWAVKKRGIKASVMLVGSLAKGTYIRDSLDIDLFILFSPSFPKEEMKKHALDIGKTVLPVWRVQYAEHPYVRGEYKRYNVDIVPCYKVKNISKKMSAVDRTPFHTAYVKKNLTQHDEVRLLKQFLKGINCYGAEAKVEGFSGYLAELLILYYGSFRRVLKNVSSFEDKIVLSLGKKTVSFKEKFVFIDPVDTSRNVAAALSEEKFNFFICAAKAYLRNPRKEFFFPKEITPLSEEKMEQSVKNFVGIRIPKPRVVDDILYPQIRKAATNIVSFFRTNDFMPEERGYHVNDEILIVIKLQDMHISEKKIHLGPPDDKKEHVASFLSKWKEENEVLKEPYIQDGRWHVEIKRKYSNAYLLLGKNLSDINFGKNLNPLRDKIQIYTDKQLINKKYAVFWGEYFSKEPPWNR
jgi:tRNA nucleotidyltransferase (CCA-adding enzyme)